ncbi:MAG: bifunctional (p)ppGpp synthetase/guanosine-3',5'-bis(diphosphate) 3'-pyrophosphohydrolase [Candidatus Lambdaproteobacteria bacterium]|nr:bifunctional (p)ppGpp synthetase/guanosine-3',5'-bis(diphosphate) 3'-pyrophosphohydrolase [Candidatus Lambdaproteobacteria bacterium]
MALIRVDDLIQKVRAYLPETDAAERIRKAYVYSATLHRNQFLPSGVPILQHALEVSQILADMRMDSPCIVAGLLHDVLQEELTDSSALRQAVGDEVAVLVEELSKLNRATYQGTEASRAEHMRQMILASTRDLRVILILLADRLQFLRSAEHLEQDKRELLARESLAIYAPIAHRLGVHYFKAEIEDRAFEIEDPRTYHELKRWADRYAAESRERIERINAELRRLLADNGIAAEVLGRTKHLYSLNAKLRRQGGDLDKIYDLLGTRIIVEATDDCYKALGLIHAAYTPLPSRFKDYIALPKDNGYRSLHTHVFDAQGNQFEIQIRTREMHRQAELGVAAHFLYKEQGTADEVELASINWFRQLLQDMENGQSPRESMELLQRDLAPNQIFVFTPKGEVIKLPPKGTAIDFAYAIHSDVGNACIGAKMDGRMIPIRTPLTNGSVVEILTSSKQRPHKDWLKFAASSKALARIRGYLRQQEKRQAIEEGREMVAREARRMGRKLDELPKLPGFSEWMRRGALTSMDELYAAEGFGRINIREVLDRLTASGEPKPATAAPARTPAQRAARPGAGEQVLVAGMDSMMTRFAKCCAPVFGDPLVGIITRGRGVSIHHAECFSLRRQAVHPERIVDVHWADDVHGERPVTLTIRAGTMKRLVELIGLLEEEEGVRITSGRVASKGGVYIQHLTLVVEDAKHIQRLLSRLNNLEGVQAERDLEKS